MGSDINIQEIEAKVIEIVSEQMGVDKSEITRYVIHQRSQCRLA